jgi:hypothetical protein
MKHFVLLSVLFALLLAALLIGTAFAQQAPPGPTSLQPGNMLPDTIAAFAARSTTLESASKAGSQWQIAQRQAYGLAQGSQTAQSGVTTARSATWESASQAEAQWQILQSQAYGLAQGSQTARSALSNYDDSLEARDAAAAMRAVAAAQSAQAAQLAPSQYDSPGGLVTSAQATELGLPALAAAKELAAQSTQTAQLAPSHFDDSIEAPQVAAAMRAMAAIHVPSMEAIRLAQASAKAAAQEKAQEARLQDPTLATPAQSARTAQLAPSQYDSPGGLVTSAQATELGFPALASAKEMAAQGAQTAQLATSHYDSLGAVTSAQARALGLPALAGVKEMAEQQARLAILQNPELLALVQAEGASRAGQTAGGPIVLPTAANSEEEEEAAESPAEVAFEEAEAAQAAGLSMSRVHSQGSVTAIQAWEITLPALTVNACSNSLAIACTANGTRPALAVR